jgi:Uma2 family endonuclease
MATLEIAHQGLTLEEFQRLPQGPPFYEFEQGEVILMSSPTLEHQDILGLLFAFLHAFLRKTRLGRIAMELDVYLPDGRIYIPDLSFVAQQHIHLLSPIDQKIHGVPTMVAEIVSNDAARDRIHKFQVYYENGVAWYWLVTQSLEIEEYHWTPQGYVRTASLAQGEVFRPQVFPGLEIDLQEMLGVSDNVSTGTAEIP